MRNGWYFTNSDHSDFSTRFSEKPQQPETVEPLVLPQEPAAKENNQEKKPDLVVKDWTGHTHRFPR